MVMFCIGFLFAIYYLVLHSLVNTRNVDKHIYTFHIFPIFVKT